MLLFGYRWYVAQVTCIILVDCWFTMIVFVFVSNVIFCLFIAAGSFFDWVLLLAVGDLVLILYISFLSTCLAGSSPLHDQKERKIILDLVMMHKNRLP